MPRYNVKVIGKSQEDSTLLGTFDTEGQSTPQIGEHWDIEVEDSVFQEYVLCGFSFKAEEIGTLFFVHPARKSRDKLVKAVAGAEA